MITYGKTVFLTTTYARSRLLDTCWREANTDFNRYIQKLRRLHKNTIQYLRTIEMHRDGYPHFHAVLRFPIVLTIYNGRYFDQSIYKSWKTSWTRGLSDAQPPRTEQSPLAYILKYTTKNSSVKIWKKYYQHLNVNAAKPPHLLVSSIEKVGHSASHVTPLWEKCEKYKIKQCTWSRNFFESLLTP